MKRLIFIMIVPLLVLQSKAHVIPNVRTHVQPKVAPWPWQHQKDSYIPSLSPAVLTPATNKPLNLRAVIEKALSDDEELKEKQIDVLVFVVDSSGVYVSIRKHTPEDLEHILNILDSIIPKSFSIDAILLNFGTPPKEKIDDVTLANMIRTALEGDEVLQTKNTKANVTVYKDLTSINMRRSDLPEAKRVESILLNVKGIQTVRIHLN